jgi:hypothetical protein
MIQFVLIDLEFFPPPDDFAAGVTKRHMQPDSDERRFGIDGLTAKTGDGGKLQLYFVR